jgi:hypothetical protein
MDVIIIQMAIQVRSEGVMHHESKNDVTIYDDSDINVAFSAAVRSYLDDGFVIAPQYMMAVQSDFVAQVDFQDKDADGDGVIRVALVKQPPHFHNSYVETISLEILHFDSPYFTVLRSIAAYRVTTAKTWYVIDNDDESSRYVASADDLARIREIRAARHENRAIPTSDVIRNHRDVARIARRHRGYARIRLDSVTRVIRQDVTHRLWGGLASHRVAYAIVFDNGKPDLRIGYR